MKEPIRPEPLPKFKLLAPSKPVEFFQKEYIGIPFNVFHYIECAKLYNDFDTNKILDYIADNVIAHVEEDVGARLKKINDINDFSSEINSSVLYYKKYLLLTLFFKKYLDKDLNKFYPTIELSDLFLLLPKTIPLHYITISFSENIITIYIKESNPFYKDEMVKYGLELKTYLKAKDKYDKMKTEYNNALNLYNKNKKIFDKKLEQKINQWKKEGI